VARLHVAIRPKRLRVLANLSQARRDLIYILLQGAKLLVKVLVYNLSLAVGLRVEYSKELNFNPKDVVEFVLEV